MKCPTHLVKDALTGISDVMAGAWLTSDRRLSMT